MKNWSLVILAALLSGCVTIDQVRTSRDIIRLDNEVLRAVQSRDDDAALPALPDLIDIGDDAAAKADALKQDSAQLLEALSYYRIAVTAYWQSHRPAGQSKIVTTSDSARQVCQTLGAQQPDRDCFFMQVAAPFAGFEQIMRAERAENGSLDRDSWKVVGGDGLTDREKEALRRWGATLGRLKAALASAYAVADKHGGVPDNIPGYYCGNVRRMATAFTGEAGSYLSEVNDYWDANPDGDFDVSQAQGSRLASSPDQSAAYNRACAGPR